MERLGVLVERLVELELGLLVELEPGAHLAVPLVVPLVVLELELAVPELEQLVVEPPLEQPLERGQPVVQARG